MELLINDRREETHKKRMGDERFHAYNYKINLLDGHSTR